MKRAKRGYAIEFGFYSYKLNDEGEGIDGTLTPILGKTYSGSLTLNQKKELEKMIRDYLRMPKND